MGLVFKCLVFSRSSCGKLPPGPRGLPVLGNIFQLPRFQWLRFTEWKEQYGPIFSLNLAGQPVIVLNNFTVAADLFERRSEIYSDRPRFIMASEILSAESFLPFLRFGSRWREMRRVVHEGFNPRSSEKYQPQQARDAMDLVKTLLKDPAACEEHILRAASSSILSTIYGWPPLRSEGDQVVQRINDVIHQLAEAALPGAYMVEVFPFMLHLPVWIAKWKRQGLEWERESSQLFKRLIEDVRGKIKAGGNLTCFLATFLENEEKYTLTAKESGWLSGTLFGAGAETTATSLTAFVLAMTLYPDVMHKAQAEIDMVVGRERTPSFSDQAQLPYIRAVVKEILRWWSPAPLAVPRRSTQDDWYNGYYIPKGKFQEDDRDPNYFPDYEEFRPERFLDKYGLVDVAPPDTHSRGHATYGFGRRICVGINWANQALFINIAMILWATNIGRAVDAEGVEITPSMTGFSDRGLAIRPKPFRCTITARSPGVTEMFESTK
ncbi:cytochrome P450 [Ramaria rubella]|nr:cytochrome P450 [Ramaria rubella]